jgi:hypothetical protein
MQKAEEILQQYGVCSSPETSVLEEKSGMVPGGISKAPELVDITDGQRKALLEHSITENVKHGDKGDTIITEKDPEEVSDTAAREKVLARTPNITVLPKDEKGNPIYPKGHPKHKPVSEMTTVGSIGVNFAPGKTKKLKSKKKKKRNLRTLQTESFDSFFDKVFGDLLNE